jgi:hypothetical protein
MVAGIAVTRKNDQVAVGVLSIGICPQTIGSVEAELATSDAGVVHAEASART